MILTTGMAHQRKLIRHAVVALLIGAGTAAGARVVPTRIVAHKDGELPAIAVYTLTEENGEPDTQMSPPELTRAVQLEITGWVAHTDALPVDDAMDDIAEQIEAAMDASPYLSNTAVEFQLAGTTMQVVEDNGQSDPMIGIITLSYVVTYRTTPTPPATPDDFLVADVTTQVANSIEDDTVPAEDTFNVRETPP